MAFSSNSISHEDLLVWTSLLFSAQSSWAALHSTACDGESDQA